VRDDEAAVGGGHCCCSFVGFAGQSSIV
jgi:hypothetical protein